MRPVWRGLAWVVGAVVVFVALVAALAFVLVRTQPGHDYLLRMALRQVSGGIDGEVTVAGVRTGNLLTGLTLHGVSIRDPDGDPVIEADSIEVQYSYRDLLRRDVVLVPARVWGPRFTLDQPAAGELSNLDRALRSLGSDEGDGGAAFGLSLRQLEIHDGDIVLRIPGEAEGDAGPEAVRGARPGGTEGVRTIRFTDVDALIDEADILSAPGGGQRFVVDRLSLTGHVLASPFRLADFRGTVVREGSGVVVEADRLRFGESELGGRVRITWDSGREIEIEAELESDLAHLEDFRWVEPGLPDGEGPMSVHVSGPFSESEWRASFEGFRIARSRISGTAGFRLGSPRITVLDSDVELLPLVLADLDPWLPEPIELPGSVRGRVTARGALTGLQVGGTVTYEGVDAALSPSTARFGGAVRLLDPVGVSGGTITLEPFRYEALAAFFPELRFAGEGRVEATVDGSLAAGFQIDAEMEHAGPEWPASRVLLRGMLRQDGDDMVVAMDGILDLLSLDGLAGGLDRELPVSGMVSGEIRAEGRLDDLAVSGRLVTSAGFVEGSSRFSALDPLSGYRAEGSVEEFRLHEIVTGVPEPTVITGDFVVDGAGGQLSELAGTLSLSLRESRIAGVELDRLEGSFAASDGRLTVEEMELVSPVATLSGSGHLALREDLPDGEVFVIWSTTSLAALRPALFGEMDPIAADTLSQLERDILVLGGVDPDTLAASDGIALEGSAEGEARFVGSVAALSADGFVEIADLVYGGTSVAQGYADFLGRWSRDGGWEAEGVVDLGGLTLGRFAFLTANGEIQYRPGAGTYRGDLRRDANETYRVVGTLAHDSLGVEVSLETLVLDFGDTEWSLSEPSVVRVSGSRIELDSLRVVRPPEPERRETTIQADGVLDLDGLSDLRVDLSGVDLRRVGRLIQSERLPGGIMDLTADITGPAAAPVITASVRVEEFLSDGAGLSRVEGTIDYRAQVLETELVGVLEDRTRVDIAGTVPVDLGLRAVEERILEREIDMTVTVDSLPAATVLAFVPALEEAAGSVSGEIRLLGTPRALRPSGEVQLRGASFLIPELGIRPGGIGVDFSLLESGIVEVEGSFASGGTAGVSGTIDLSDVTDPEFDLFVSAAGFQAVERRDMTVRFGGDLRLTGSYTAPQVGGFVRVEQGELFLDEFVRAAEVVDLTDPLLRDLADSTFAGVAPGANPFLQNLRVDVELALQRDFWLRSTEINTEIGGNLLVTYDRPEREIVLVGELEAVRGTYEVVGKQFQVSGGTVTFVGTPGINPALNIEAVTRLRREAGDPLNVTARVQGTLASPRVTLTSDAQPPIVESDLISYLIFGRPSYALASGETSVLRRSLGAGEDYVVGTIASRLGTAVARQIGVDYFTITQTQDAVGLESAAGLSGSFANTQVEVGHYVGQDLFLALLLRPLTGLGAVSRTQFPGVRLEWRFTDTWSVEGFVEDRFAREPSTGFGALGLRLSKVLGLSLYREWGY